MCLYLVLFGFKTIVFADELSCNRWVHVKQDVQNVFNFAKLLIPLLVIGLSTIDFIKSVYLFFNKFLLIAYFFIHFITYKTYSVTDF